MSTTCSISIDLDDKIKTITCHWDGYLSYVGAILLKHYTIKKNVLELISHGNLRYLGNTPHSSFYYHQDGKEDWEYMKPTLCKKNDYIKIKEDYNYLFKNNQWYVNNQKLTKKLIENREGIQS